MKILGIATMIVLWTGLVLPLGMVTAPRIALADEVEDLEDELDQIEEDLEDELDEIEEDLEDELDAIEEDLEDAADDD